MVEKVKLTEPMVRLAKPAAEGARITVLDALVPGLALRITDKGKKTWVAQGRVRGGAGGVRVKLGTYPILPLADAREKAREVMQLMAAGRDPRLVIKAQQLEERRKDADTFEAIARDFIAKHLSKNRTGDRDAGLIERDLIPVWGPLRITEIRRRDIADLIDKLAKQTKDKKGRKIGGGVAANRRMSLIRKLFNWCLSRGIVEANPAARMERVGEERARDRVLSDAELRLVWLGAGRLGGAVGAAVKVMMLTAQRRGECGGMRDALVDRQAGLWTIPGEEAKNGKDHLVPLAPLALDVIEGFPEPDANGEISPFATFLFTTTGTKPINGWSKAKTELDAKIAEVIAETGAKPIAPWTMHDLRRTAATGMARLGVEQFTIGKVLNHTDRSVTGMHYNRFEYLPQKRDALERWATHLRLVIDPPANVVRLQAAS